MARAVRWRPVRWAMSLGIQTLVPRHRVGVALVPLDRQGRILLLHHVFHPFVPWGLPGGWLARGEKPERCALRELQEETGLTARLGPVVHLVKETVPAVHVNVAYLGYVDPGPVSLSTEILEIGWFAPDALPDRLFPFTREAIAAALRFHAQSNGTKGENTARDTFSGPEGR